jgi:uncharacterized membrane protein
MNERNQLIVVLLLTSLLALAGFFLPQQVQIWFEEDAIISNYKATIYPNFIIEEDFTYLLKKEGFRFLFRFWEDPVSLTKLMMPYYEPTDIIGPDGTIWYIKDHYGNLVVESPYEDNPSIYSQIRLLANNDEVGVFNPNSFQTGSYQVKYVHRLYPLIEKDNQDYHLNVKLAKTHIKYKKMTIILENADYISKLFVHPPTLKKTETGNRIILEGSSAKNELLEVEMLFKPSSELYGFEVFVENVKDKTENANFRYNLQYWAAYGVNRAIRLMSLAMPFFFYYLYNRYGREEDFIVPTYLSTIPNRNRKPWLVNLIFKNDARDYDEDGFYSTILDLHVNDKIYMKRKAQGGFTIKILNDEGLDKYERKVIKFLKDLAVKNVVDTDYMQGLSNAAQKDQRIAKRVISLINSYNDLTSGPDRVISDKFTENGRIKLTPLIIISVLVFFTPIFMLTLNENIHHILFQSLIISFIPLLQTIIAYAFPSTLLGKWKKGIYKEKLEWNAFTRHLGDFAQIKKYVPEDINMWGPWLVYGTSLGVGDQVAIAMQQLNISYEIAEIVPVMPLIFRPIITA